MRYNLTMSQTATFTGNQLTNALRALDINFILGGQSKDESLHKQPARLIAALAQNDESRLRLSLIPLFLEHPEFSLRVQTVVKRLDPIYGDLLGVSEPVRSSSHLCWEASRRLSTNISSYKL